MWTYVYPVELYHTGRKGMKKGQHIYCKGDGCPAKVHVGSKGTDSRYLKDNGKLTFAGNKQFAKLNALSAFDDDVRLSRAQAQRNIDRFSKGKSIVSKALTELNTKHLSNFDKTIARNDERIKKIIADLQNERVDVVAKYEPITGQWYYDQSSEQRMNGAAKRDYRFRDLYLYDKTSDGRIKFHDSAAIDSDTKKKIRNIEAKYDKQLESAKNDDEIDDIEIARLDELDQLLYGR